MADRTIVNLPELESVTSSDLLLTVTTINNEPTNRKITVNNFKSLPTYADNTAIAAVTTEPTGSLAYVESPKSLVIYDGSNWLQLATTTSLT